MILGAIAFCVSQILTCLIGLITNLSFYGRFSLNFTSPAGNRLGLWVIVVPAIGGIVVGFMARYGSKAIRGHGIPEAMEQILLNESRIPARMTFLKPLSAAIAIRTGGPFGAEGPIIATGGALGSLIESPFGVDVRIAALVGMASAFAGASRALLASVLFAFETTRDAHGVLPVLGGCSTAFLISAFLMRHTIRSERLARRGHHVPTEYSAT
jgi:H+/Cl- antiporter ClcA